MDVVSVRINSRIMTPRKNRNHPERPSLYSTNMNPRYTRADPVSFSATIMSIGTAMTAATSSKSFKFDSLKLVLLIMVASTREVAILETSAGWKLTGPRLNQE